MDPQNIPAWLPISMIILALWTIPWKGWALWKAARRGENIWFIVLLVLNTGAILELLYIFIFSRDKKNQPATSIPVISQ